MKKVYFSWADVHRYTQDILRQLAIDSWKPDYVVGITPGGLVPATLISSYLDIPLETLKVSIEPDGSTDNCETNCWMSEDAFSDKNILIVDNICSSDRYNWLIADWQSSCFDKDGKWNSVWGNSVRFSAIALDDLTKIGNEADEVPVYASYNFNSNDEPQTLVFPWQDHWKR